MEDKAQDKPVVAVKESPTDVIMKDTAIREKIGLKISPREKLLQDKSSVIKKTADKPADKPVDKSVEEPRDELIIRTSADGKIEDVISPVNITQNKPFVDETVQEKNDNQSDNHSDTSNSTTPTLNGLGNTVKKGKFYQKSLKRRRIPPPLGIHKDFTLLNNNTSKNTNKSVSKPTRPRVQYLGKCNTNYFQQTRQYPQTANIPYSQNGMVTGGMDNYGNTTAAANNNNSSMNPNPMTNTIPQNYAMTPFVPSMAGNNMNMNMNLNMNNNTPMIPTNPMATQMPESMMATQQDLQAAAASAGLPPFYYGYPVRYNDVISMPTSMGPQLLPQFYASPYYMYPPQPHLPFQQNINNPFNNGPFVNDNGNSNSRYDNSNFNQETFNNNNTNNSNGLNDRARQNIISTFDSINEDSAANSDKDNQETKEDRDKEDEENEEDIEESDLAIEEGAIPTPIFTRFPDEVKENPVPNINGYNRNRNKANAAVVNANHNNTNNTNMSPGTGGNTNNTSFNGGKNMFGEIRILANRYTFEFTEGENPELNKKIFMSICNQIWNESNSMKR